MYVLTITSDNGDERTVQCKDTKQALSTIEFFLHYNKKIVIEEKKEEPMYIISYAWNLLYTNWHTEEVPASQRYTRVRELSKQGYKVLPPEPKDEEEE